MSEYLQRVNNEINAYCDNVNVHDLPVSHQYLLEKIVTPKFRHIFDVDSLDALVNRVVKKISEKKKEEEIRILSIGSGNCDFEINLLKKYSLRCTIDCHELNLHMINRARENANKEGINQYINFYVSDLNLVEIVGVFDLVIASHSLHHIEKLEKLFESIHTSMTDESYFIINDMIGRNGHMFWDNTFDFCKRLWATFPKELKYNRLLNEYTPKRVQHDCSTKGFEGIRAQDILPLLDQYFSFKDFLPFFSIANKFTDRDFGHNFNMSNPHHIAILDNIGAWDEYFLNNKLLKPTQLIATLVKKNVTVKDYRYVYFEKPSEIYSMDESLFYVFFDTMDEMKKWRRKKSLFDKFIANYKEYGLFNTFKKVVKYLLKL